MRTMVDSRERDRDSEIKANRMSWDDDSVEITEPAQKKRTTEDMRKSLDQMKAKRG